MKPTLCRHPGVGRFPGTLAAWLSVLVALFHVPTARAVDCNGFKIWSFNIRYSDGWACASDCDDAWYRTVGRIARRNVAESYMKAYAPDIFGLQEVRDPAESAGTRVSQLNDVAGWFPTHGYYARDRGDGEHCAIFYRSSRFIRLNAGTFWMSCFPDVPESKHPVDHLGGDPQRITSWVMLHDITTGVVFYVFNSHWSLNGSAQLYSAALVRQRAHQIAGGLPVILLGDLNCRETETAFSILSGNSTYSGSTDCLIQPTAVPRQNLPLANSYREVHPTVADDEATYHNFAGGSTGGRIDHVLHTPEHFSPTTAVIRRDTYSGHCSGSGCYPSDHYALEVRFRMLLPNVRVDFRASEITCETGSPASPFNTLGEAFNVVRANGTVTLSAGSIGGALTINPTRGPVTITSAGGPSVIGK